MEKTAAISSAISSSLPWLWIGAGVCVALIGYLWAIRARIREGIRKRRRRPEKYPHFDEDDTALSDDVPKMHAFGDLGYITSGHHLADKALVDVEIRPIYRDAHAPSPPPPLSTWQDAAPEEVPPASPPTLPKSTEKPPQKPPQMSLALTVIAPRGQPFLGLDIQTVAEALFYQLGENSLFESYEIDADTPIVSVAHLRAPGIFDPMTLHDLKTPGLLLFTHLPGPLSGMESLDALVAAADQWAHKLGGMICDEKRYRMSNHDLLRLRDKIQEFEQRLRLFTASQK